MPDCTCKTLLHEKDCPYWDGTRCAKCNVPVYDGKYHPKIKFYCSDECAKNAE